MSDRVIDYCCPAAVRAYPAPCPAHGQDRPDIVTAPDGVVVAPGGWCAPLGSTDHTKCEPGTCWCRPSVHDLPG